MTAKFGFQVTVQDRIIWIFPEDIDAAEIAAKAEEFLKQALIDELAAQVITTDKKLTDWLDTLSLPAKVREKIDGELAKVIEGTNDEKIKQKIAIATKNVSLETIEEKVGNLKVEAKGKIDALKAKASAGITYAWRRAAGENPIELGTIDNLVHFIQEKIVKKLGLSFNVEEQFNDMVSGLPDPINGALEALKSGAVFELDSIRLKIPGKGAIDADGKPEATQFEIAMLINLVALDLELGPFQLNRLYAQLGNFGSATYAPEPDAA